MNENEISSAVGEYLGQAQSDDKIRLRESMGIALKSQPDFEAEIQNVSLKTGVPLETVRSIPEEVKTQAKIQEVDVDDLALNFPKASKFLSEPKNAAVSSDDIGVMKTLENGWGAFKSGIEKGSIQDDMAELLYKDLNGEITPAESKRLELLKAQMSDVEKSSSEQTEDSKLAYFLNQTGYAGRQMISSVREGAKGGAAGAAAGAGVAVVAGQLGPQVALPEELVTVPGAAMAGGRYGFLAGSAWQSYRAESGFAWDEFKSITDEAGRPLDPSIAKGAAKAVGIINAGLDVIGEQAMMKLFPGLDKLTAIGPKAAVRELLKNQTTAQALAVFGKNWVKAATIEGLTEGVQELSVILGGEVAKFGDGGQFQSANIPESASRVGQAAQDAFVGSLGLGAAGGVTNQVQLTVRDKIEARKMEQNANLIKAIGDTAKESKLLERMPEKYKELVSTIKEGGPVENVFIPADQFTKYFQSQGVDPALVAQEIGAANYSEAVAAGSDIMVPIESYASTIAKTEHHDALAQDIRFYQSDKTLREYAESLQQKQEQQARIKELAEQELQTDQQVQAAKEIQAKFKENLIQVGTDPSTAEAYATSYARAMVTLAARNGMDPVQLAERYGLTVSRPMPEALNKQRSDISIDPILDALRAGKVPTDSEIYGPSLTEFIKSKGGVKPHGDLQALVDDGKKGFARIQNSKAQLDLDKMAMSAVEAGYFTGREYGSVTEAEFLDAINNDQDTPMYSPKNLNQDLEQYRILGEQIGSYLKRLGVDLSVITDNAQVRKLLEEGQRLIDENAPKPGELGSDYYLQLAGRKSATAQFDKLVRAASMENRGVDMETIRKETGWFKGQDLRWRYEISDANAKPKDIQIKSAKTYKLGDLIEHEELFAAYPQLKDVGVKIGIQRGSTGGSFNKSKNEITVLLNKYPPALEKKKDDLFDIEQTKVFKDFEAKYFNARTTAMRKAAWAEFNQTDEGKRRTEIYKELAENKDKAVAPKKLTKAAMSTLLHEVQHAIQNIEGFANGAAGRKSYSGTSSYYNTLGEVEARDTQNRQGMTAEDRKNNPPSQMSWKAPVINWNGVVKELPIEEMPKELVPFVMGEQMTLFQGRNLPETIDIDGVQRPTLNSEGKPIAGSEEAIRNFWNWFGDSKVVDEQGRPNIYYRMTDSDRTEFRKSYRGGLIYFAARPDGAERASMAGTGVTYPVYLKATNIRGMNGPGVYFGDAEKTGYEDKLIKGGFDAVRVRDEASRYGGTIAVLNPTQIKSAIGNEGTFDPINPSILKQSDDEAKGYIQFGKDRKFNIALLEKSDLSTMLHELGHFYLEVIHDLATAENAPDQMKQDFQTLLDWFGVDAETWKGFSLEQRREYHERFARAHEAYLMEGKAPSEELRSIFSRFKDWLKFIYKQLAALNVKLTDDVRNVFDRMYATDDEIIAARKEVPIDPLFATAKDAGMSEAEFAVYSKAAQKQIESGREALMAKLMTEIQREKKAWWLKSKNETRQEVEAEVSSRPEYVAFEALKAGKIDDETPIKLNRQALKDKYGSEYVKRIPSQIMTKDGGMDADSAAQYLGYSSGDKLIEDMVSLKPKDMVIKAEVDKRMVEKHGDMLLDMSVVDQAKIALHNQDREKVLMTELQAINRKRKEVAPFVRAAMNNQKQKAQAALDIPPKEFFHETAREIVTNTAVKDIQSYAYLRAQRKAAKESFENMGKGNFELAKQAKERELLNHYLYIEATNAKEEADKILEYAKKFEKKETRERIGKAGGDYLSQIDSILDRYEFRRIPLSKLEKRRNLLDWVQEQEAQGLEPAIDERILDEARSVNYKEIPIGELRAVRDSVKNIEHLARLKNKLILKNQKIEFQDAVGELVSAASINGNNVKIPIDPNARSFSEKFKDGVIGIVDAPLIKMEQMIEWLDGGNVEGPWHKYLWNPIAEAQFAEHDLTKKVTKKIVESLEKLPSEQRKSMLDTYDVPGMGNVTKKYIMSIAFNMGNQENIDKMMKGHNWSMTTIEAALQNLNAADWQFVQETWDTINELWPQIAELEKKMSGVVPPKVESKPYVAYGRDGEIIAELKGGYFPLVYDPRFSEQGAKQEGGDVSQMFEQGYVRATTQKGHTKARVENFAAPLMLDFEHVVTSHITKVIKDLTHREAIVAANKVITNKEVRAALQTALGVQYERQFLPWLRSVVNDRNAASTQGVGELSKFMLTLRANVVAATMGFKATTSIAQIVGLSNSLDKVKGRYLSRALTDFLKHPVKVSNEVREMSGEIRYRAENLDRDIRGRLQQLINDNSPYAKAQKFAFHGIALADTIVAVPTWLGAYRQAIDEGRSREAAILEADAAVRLTQGAGGAKDLSAVQRSNEMMKLITMFYSYFNVLYNRMRDMGRDVQDIRDMPKFLSRMFFTVAVPAVIGELIVGRGPDDDEDEAMWVIRKVMAYPAMSIPILRDIVASMESGYDYRFTPMATGLEKISKLAVSTGKLAEGDMEWSDYAAKATSTIGYVAGVPGTAQITASSKYLWKVAEGEENPENIAELIKYTTMGKQSK